MVSVASAANAAKIGVIATTNTTYLELTILPSRINKFLFIVLDSSGPVDKPDISFTKIDENQLDSLLFADT